MFWLFVGLAVITAIYYYLIKPHKYWTERGVKQTSPVFLFGDSWQFLVKTMSGADAVKKVYDAYPNTRYFGMYQFLKPSLVLRDPELIKQITVKDFDHFLDHPPFVPAEADPFWGSNLFALTGQKWKDMRPTVSPAFTSSKMKQMFVLISESAKHFVNHFLNKKEDLITVELKDIFTRYANDVIATTAFGIKCDSLEERDNEFYRMGKGVINLDGFMATLKIIGFLLVPKIMGFFKVGFFTKTQQNFFLNIVKQTIKAREEQGIIRHDLIHLLMEARKHGLKYEESNDTNVNSGFATVEESHVGKSQKIQKPEITDVFIAGQGLIFFFAGFDSVSNLMCFTSYELGINPEIQKRLQEEIDETLNCCNGKLTYEALLKMKYLDMVVCESLRKWPNTPTIDRACTKPYTIQPTSSDEKPVHLNKDDILWIPIYALQRDPQYYPDPDKFDPERFSDENKGSIIPYSYIPFGSGPRNCIGSRFAILETKALMFHLLSKFDIVPIEKTQIPVKLSTQGFGLKAENGFWFGLKRRNLWSK